RVQHRLQKATDDLLGDAIGDRWNAQWTRPSIRLRDIDPPHRRRKVAPRGHAIPELVEVAREVGLELHNRLSVHSSRSLVRLHTLEGFPDLALRDRERLCLVHALLPRTVGARPRLNNAIPSVQFHYRTFRPTTDRSAPVLRIGTL